MGSHYLKVDVDGINKRITFLKEELVSLRSDITVLAKNHKPVLYSLAVSMNKHEGLYFDLVLDGDDIYERDFGRFSLQNYLKAGNVIDLSLKLDLNNNNFYYELINKLSQFANAYVPEQKRYLVLGDSVVINMCEANVNTVPIYFKDIWTAIPFVSQPSGLTSKDWKKFYSPEDAIKINYLLEAIKKNLEEIKSLNDLLKEYSQ